MKFFRTLWASVFLCLGVVVNAQAVPPIDHVVIRDPRVFDLSGDGSVYELSDGPLASADIQLVHGTRGALAATATIGDDHLNSWGPVSLTGKVRVKSTKPMSIKLKGGGKALPKISIVGTYDASVQLMRVVVKVRTPEGLQYQWNDAFVPEHADDVGLKLDRVSVATNAKGVIIGEHSVTAPGGAVTVVSSKDRQLANSDFQLKAKGVNLIGDYNIATDSYHVFNAKVNTGYGTIFTPGALVDTTSDGLFPRNL